MKIVTIILSFIATSLFFNFSYAEEVLNSPEGPLVAEESMYEQLKAEFRKGENEVPTYEDFYRIGEDEGRICREVEKAYPNETRRIGIYLFVRHFAAEGPLFPERSVPKIIVHNNPNLGVEFDRVSNDITNNELVSTYDRSQDDEWKTYIKKRDDLIFFRRRGTQNEETFEAYGYCYHL